MTNQTRAELEGLHSVLRRSLERMERKAARRRAVNDNDAPDPAADMLAAQVAEIAAELDGLR